jgi:hypothetical protein
LCDRCGGRRKVLTFLTDPDVIGRILLHLGEPVELPEVAPARLPPVGDGCSDRSVAKAEHRWERRALVGAAVAGVCTDQEMTPKTRRFHAGSRIIAAP